MNILITICARGGSKGVPGKNIKPIGGLPLIVYTINAANNMVKYFESEGHVAHVTLATDSTEIRDTAGVHGLATEYLRPAHLATDSSGKLDAIHDVLLYEEKRRSLRYDYVLDLDVTSPLRTLEDLKKGWTMILDDPKALNLFSVNPANRNPYFNIVEDKGDGYVKVCKSLGEHVLSRQAAPTVYDINGSFYYYRREGFDIEGFFVISERSLVYVMPHICFDIDHPFDFEMMKYVIEENRLDFELA